MKNQLVNKQVIRAISIGLSAVMAASPVVTMAETNGETVTDDAQQENIEEFAGSESEEQVALVTTFDEAEASIDVAMKKEAFADAEAILTIGEGVITQETLAIIAESEAKKDIVAAENIIDCAEESIDAFAKTVADEKAETVIALEKAAAQEESASNLSMVASVALNAANEASDSATAQVEADKAKEAADAAKEAADEAQVQADAAKLAYEEALSAYEQAVLEAAEANAAANEAIENGYVDAKEATERAEKAKEKADALKLEVDEKYEEVAGKLTETEQAYAKAELNLIDATKELGEATINEGLAAAATVSTGVAVAEAGIVMDLAKVVVHLVEDDLEQKKQAVKDLIQAKADAEEALEEAKEAVKKAENDKKVEASELEAAKKALQESEAALEAASAILENAKVELEQAEAIEKTANEDLNSIMDRIAGSEYETAVKSLEDQIADAKESGDAAELALLTKALIITIMQNDEDTQFDGDDYDVNEDGLIAVTKGDTTHYYGYEVAADGKISVYEYTYTYTKVVESQIDVQGKEELNAAISGMQEGTYQVETVEAASEGTYAITLVIPRKKFDKYNNFSGSWYWTDKKGNKITEIHKGIANTYWAGMHLLDEDNHLNVDLATNVSADELSSVVADYEKKYSDCDITTKYNNDAVPATYKVTLYKEEVSFAKTDDIVDAEQNYITGEIAEAQGIVTNASAAVSAAKTKVDALKEGGTYKDANGNDVTIDTDKSVDALATDATEAKAQLESAQKEYDAAKEAYDVAVGTRDAQQNSWDAYYKNETKDIVVWGHKVGEIDVPFSSNYDKDVKQAGVEVMEAEAKLLEAKLALEASKQLYDIADKAHKEALTNLEIATEELVRAAAKEGKVAIEYAGAVLDLTEAKAAYDVWTVEEAYATDLAKKAKEALDAAKEAQDKVDALRQSANAGDEELAQAEKDLAEAKKNAEEAQAAADQAAIDAQSAKDAYDGTVARVASLVASEEANNTYGGNYVEPEQEVVIESDDIVVITDEIAPLAAGEQESDVIEETAVEEEAAEDAVEEKSETVEILGDADFIEREEETVLDDEGVYVEVENPSAEDAQPVNEAEATVEIAEEEVEIVDETVIEEEQTPLAAEDVAPNASYDGVVIEDEEAPLAALSEVEKRQMSWWWLIIVAILGVSGVEMYRRHQKKAAEQSTSERNQ